MKFKIYIIYIVFSFYWATTFFFTIPENYITIKALKYEKLFSLVLYQKWQFFAPPPKSNERLYYEYVTSKNDTIILEVLKPLAQKRKQEFLLNSDRSTIDYILANNIYALSDFLRENYSVYKNKSNNNSVPDELNYQKFLTEFYPTFHKYNELKSLANYGVLIMDDSNITSKSQKFKIISTNIKIKKFNNRMELQQKDDESIVFETKYFNLKNKKWEN